MGEGRSSSSRTKVPDDDSKYDGGTMKATSDGTVTDIYATLAILSSVPFVTIMRKARGARTEISGLTIS